MLQHIDNAIVETTLTTTANTAQWDGLTSGGSGAGGYSSPNLNCWPQTTYYWNSYPVYICTDKTRKAIEVLKALEEDGLKVQSVPKFIKLVEKIAGIL